MRRRRWGRYPERKPAREVKGGIKAQSQRGEFGSSWWAKRWIQVLESFDIGARLGRGRTYARKGQVMSIEVEQGKVQARVQGSRPTPYSVTIELAPLDADEWKKVVGELSRQAIFAAKLLGGEMPQDVEQAFKAVDVPLFPRKSRDLVTDCSCPDWSNPCKHVAAVYYLLGEEFDRDPFLLFRLRGMERDDLLRQLGTHSPAATEEPRHQPQPLAEDAGAFWHGPPLPPGLLGEVQIPPVHAALPQRLGGFPFWRGAQPLLDVLGPWYRQAGAAGKVRYEAVTAPTPGDQS